MYTLLLTETSKSMYQFTERLQLPPDLVAQWRIKLGGHGAMAHLAIDNTNIRTWFSSFPNFRKVGKFVPSIERPKAKVFQLRGGVCPWTPLGASPTDPRYRLALAMVCPRPLSHTFRGLCWCSLSTRAAATEQYWMDKTLALHA